MNSEFARSLDHVLGGVGRNTAPQRPAPQPKPKAAPQTPDSRHRKWFAHFAADRVMPLLTHTVEALKARGITARCGLLENGEEVTAELVITPPGLPAGERPPRFAAAAAPGTRGLAIDYTGTFPAAGPEGGFGAEVTYDTVYTSELEEQLIEFVRKAVGT